jgi:N-methylhydantoinase B
MEIGGEDDLEFACNAIFDRISNPPKGREGGGEGAGGIVALKSGARLRSKGFQVIPEGDRLVLHLPGGGGMGPATARAPALVARDVLCGLVSRQSAEQDYGVKLLADGSVDEAATQDLRKEMVSP